MTTCIQIKKPISVVGTYKAKKENIIKLKIYLKKIKDGAGL